ncbi:lysylphosphatidylglycerol synthase transmembrane domain-containing protein [Sphingobium sp. DEHP117]|uniref:lysylphosphatidylglycerol synthase transmembrane domain-containing protein n=1 Tax=Sphingobium sp. DEHP117 TaxID=2993436 RepID=UPI0027D59392|nr:flippase-like domain-containing protein [Sphingobium sp. DEHP117]MDQ4421048.1 lysylphosphatidylglycerol synthase transmembrane domain-containing protein [Sphingobium sp. DEHP117]
MASSRKRYLVWAVQIAVSAVLLAFIFHFVPLAQVWGAAKRLSPQLWLAGFALFLIGHALTAAKWWMLIGHEVRFARAFRAHLAGLGANLALPGVAGGDVVRAALVMGETKDKGRLAVGSLVDRLIDTASLALVALVGAWFAFNTDGRTTGLVVGGIVVVVAIKLTLLRLLSARIAAFAAWLSTKGKAGRILGKIIAASAEMGRQPGLLLGCFILSLAVQCLFVLINIAFALALGVMIPAAAWFYAWAGAKIIAILPISLGGLGLREASMAALLQPFGVNTGAVIAIGLIWQTVLYASGILGLLVQAGFAALPGKSTSPLDPKPHIG